MPLEIVLPNETIRTPPCSACDYLFTLLVSFIWAGALVWYNAPWWAIVLVVHFQSVMWFFKTRPWVTDRKRP